MSLPDWIDWLRQSRSVSTPASTPLDAQINSRAVAPWPQRGEKGSRHLFHLTPFPPEKGSRHLFRPQRESLRLRRIVFLCYGLPLEATRMATMDARRPAGWQEPVENAEDAVDRGDLDRRMLRARCGRYSSAEPDPAQLEIWRRGLAATIQPPAGGEASPVLQHLVDPDWLRAAYRGTREDVRRLLRAGHRQSRSASRLRLPALAGGDPTTLGSDDAAPSSAPAAPQEAPQEGQARLRIRR